jgi:hypothetical protein
MFFPAKEQVRIPGPDVRAGGFGGGRIYSPSKHEELAV